eukprot:4913041-Pyramimonas_sp.AAC.1
MRQAAAPIVGQERCGSMGLGKMTCATEDATPAPVVKVSIVENGPTAGDLNVAVDKAGLAEIEGEAHAPRLQVRFSE